MLNVTKDTITDLVIAALAKDIPDRNRQIMTSLIRHMHAFCKEVDLTFAEWFAACEFLRRAGDAPRRGRAAPAAVTPPPSGPRLHS